MTRALVVIDVQGEMAAYRDEGNPWANPRAEDAIAGLIAGFRGANLPVIHVHHHETHPGASMVPGSDAAAPLICAVPGANEMVFIKHGSSAFIGTGLEAYLRAQGLTELVIIGGEANMCVESSTRMAANLGFKVTLAQDALINFQRTGHDGTLIPAPMVLTMSMANLNRSFAKISTTQDVLAELPA